MVSNWQFFLQKQGSRAWKKISSSTFDLPEGIYRIMALTDLKNTEIKVCVLHQYLKKGESKQRFYTSSHVSDEKGLLPILPFTHLKPQTWELFCHFTNDGPPKETLTIAVKEIKENFKPQLQIVLNQEHFILEADEKTILIAGIIKHRYNIGELTEDLEGKLYYQLRNSRTGEILLSKEEDILTSLPHSFKHIINNINWSEELLLGEVILADKNLNIITRESFTITINLEQLLHRGKYKRYSHHIELFRFDKPLNNFEQFNHSNGQVLPPKIASNNTFYRRKIIDLPRFSNPLDSSTVTESQESFSSQVKPKSLKIDQEFASLNLENRFFSRLHNLAIITRNTQPKIEPESTLVVQDMPRVKEDIPSIITNHQLDTLSVPSPILTILSEEIVSGTCLDIKISVPRYTNNISVKLWLQDRQTRSLLIEPISVHGFILNEDQELETTTRLKIPYGSVEILLEAIAIDNKTKRESYKTSLILPLV
jgi:hypothetical protein